MILRFRCQVINLFLSDTNMEDKEVPNKGIYGRKYRSNKAFKMYDLNQYIFDIQVSHLDGASPPIW